MEHQESKETCCEHSATTSGMITSYATPQAAVEAGPREKIAFVVNTRFGTAQADQPDALSVVDVDDESPNFGKIIYQLDMPYVGDELHHSGWNACSSATCCITSGGGCADHHAERRFLIVPGLRSSRIYIVDCRNVRRPSICKVIEPEEVKCHDVSSPHTIHCAPGGLILLSCLGNAQGDTPGGILELDASSPTGDFHVLGRWDRTDVPRNRIMHYDFWYMPRHNAMLSSEWAAPRTFFPGLNAADVEAGKYGRRLHVWNWKERIVRQTIDLGPQDGNVPLEIRCFHSPESCGGFVGVALSGTIVYVRPDMSAPLLEDGSVAWRADTVITVPPRRASKSTAPDKAIEAANAAEAPQEDGGEDSDAVPAVISDVVLSLDDRYLFFSCWLHGEVRMYDVSDALHPRLKSTLRVGGMFAKKNDAVGRPTRLQQTAQDGDRQPIHEAHAGPQMLQLSLDGTRLYFTTSLFSSYDDQFFKEEGKAGSLMFRAHVDPRRGTMELDRDFCISFEGIRAHEIRWPSGDCTSDIWS